MTADSTPSHTLNRVGSKKRKLRNLIRRGRVWYWKCMVAGQMHVESLKTDNLVLAEAKRAVKEQQLVAGELAKLREVKQAGMLAEVFRVYDQLGGISDKAVYGNKRALLNFIWTITGDDTLLPEQISLALITKKGVRDYQDKFRKRYEEAAGPKADDRADARDKADRSSASLISQAQSLFAKRRELVDRYREAGIIVPACVLEFASAKTVGSNATKFYFPPSDAALRATFTAIEAQRTTDPALYELFWCNLATGARKGELTDLQPEHFVVINDRLWLNGGRGKDGKVIQIPVINFPVHTASPVVPADIVTAMIKRTEPGQYLFGGSDNARRDKLPRRLNEWLAAHGWQDQKKIHALRGYVGSMLYVNDPRLAQKYLRHKSRQTTEAYYTHFTELEGVTRLQVVAPVQAPVPLAAAVVSK